MPSFNNYTFTNIQYTIPEGDNVSILYPTAQITIVPNSGYTAAAADFSLDPSFSDNAVQSVVFTQSSLNVLCTVTFNTGFVMPSGNYTIPLCVVGEGGVSLITIGGTISATVGPNITGDVTENNTPYSNSGSLGETELLLTRTYTADAGFSLNSGGLQVITGNASNYNIVQAPTYDGDGNLTSISYAVNYIYPNQSINGDVLQVRRVSAKGIYVAPPAPVVTGYGFLPTSVSPKGTTISNWEISGEIGATFSIVMTSQSGGSWNLATNQVIPATGSTTLDVSFPTIVGIANEEIYTITFSGGIDPALINPIIMYQFAVSPRIEFTGSSVNGITGYTPVTTERSALTRLVEDSNLITIEWDISTPNGLLQFPNTTSTTVVTSMDQAASVLNTALVSNSTSLDLEDTTGIAVGDNFNLPTTAFEDTTSSGFAPFQFEVTAVNSATNITVSPAISMLEDNLIIFWRNNGNISEFESVSYIPTADSSGALSLVFDVTGYGDADSTFVIDLDTIFNFVPNLACATAAISGGVGITDYALSLDSAGGLVAFLVNGQGLPDKFEIFHGLPFANDKKATSGMVASENFGPFENNFGTSPLNAIPTTLQLEADQFIGSNKYAPLPFAPSRTTEFNSDTGFTIPSMTIGGTTYQQVVWWEYTAADYTKNPNATIRITGPTGTGWDALRLCCPDGNCT
tara:strand:- start:2435 stop:4495 length:2061 start_codon:yes stop_codon:yes gene_type:complete